MRITRSYRALGSEVSGEAITGLVNDVLDEIVTHVVHPALSPAIALKSSPIKPAVSDSSV
ncbi:hypothetical protein [cf. Phormidesmis sp. LEGE 11477]|uniref:hypothetical protein n=1 Tax=cf. Phormidesmis sp. LEGE 11477 TaxID=1828680 RepID=UPI001D1368F6|nr:hypothetical protein [cf. Phormidesmis sp. LEGE 11477]